jgi:hypothetical protein
MRAIGLQELKLAFERAGTVLPAAEPPAPEAPVERAHRIIEPDPPRCQWVSPYHREPVELVRWEYDPWSKERLR